MKQPEGQAINLPDQIVVKWCQALLAASAMLGANVVLQAQTG